MKERRIEQKPLKYYEKEVSIQDSEANEDLKKRQKKQRMRKKLEKKELRANTINRR